MIAVDEIDRVIVPVHEVARVIGHLDKPAIVHAKSRASKFAARSRSLHEKTRQRECAAAVSHEKEIRKVVLVDVRDGHARDLVA